MNVTSFKTMNYEQRTMNDANKNKPNQTQFQTCPNPPDSHNHLKKMETKGIEPSFPRCDRGVFPLHYVPKITFKSYFIEQPAKIQKVFKSRQTNNLELPPVVAEYLLYRLALRLLRLVSRITECHQLDYSDTSRNIQYCSYFVRIERPDPARRQP